MNIILFSAEEVELPLPGNDPRAAHIINVLRRQPGESFDAGLINGPRGKGTLVAAGPDSLTLAFAWGDPTPPLGPITLLIGLPRPQTARDILRDATALGVGAMHFVRTEKAESSYAASSLWKTGAWKECVISGAAQAFCTRLPQVSFGRSLVETLAGLPATGGRLALDNYESSTACSATDLTGSHSITLAVGAERGWSGAERRILRTGGFTFVHLGDRILRTETACIVALTLIKAKLGSL